MSTQEITPAPAGPPLLSRGIYSLYGTPDGGALLSFRPDGQEGDSHQQIPAALWQLLGQAVRGERVTLPMVLKAVSGLR